METGHGVLGAIRSQQYKDSMTERDKYPREVGHQWEDTLNTALALAPVDAVAVEAIHCLAKMKNPHGVIPGLEDVLDIVQGTASTTAQLAALNRLNTHHRHKYTAVAIEEAKRICLEQVLLPRRSGPPSREVICRRILNALMETCCFATVRVAMQAEGLFGSPRACLH